MNYLNSIENNITKEIDKLEDLHNFKLIFENILSFSLFLRSIDEINVTLNNFNTYQKTLEF